MAKSNKFDKINAANIFTLQRSGTNVPPQIRAAARRILQDKAQPTDAEVVRSYRGIKKSGAGKLKGQLGQIQSQVRFGQNVEASVENVENVLSRGGNPLPAGIRLVSDLTNQFQTYLKTKFVKNAAASIAQFIGSDSRAAQSLLFGLRRASAVASVWLGAAGFGVDIGSRVGLGLFDARAARQKLAGASYDAARANNIDIGNFSGQSRRLMSDVEAHRSIIQELKDALGFDEATTAEKKQRIELRASNIARARKAATELGMNPDQFVALYANKLGKMPSELTEREQALAIDFATRQLTDPKRHAMDPRVDTKLALKDNAYKLWFGALFADEQALEREKIYETEVLPDTLDAAEKAAQRRQFAGENTRTRLFDDGAEWLQWWKNTELPAGSETGWQSLVGTVEDGRWVTTRAERQYIFRREQEQFAANYAAEVARRKVVEYD